MNSKELARQWFQVVWNERNAKAIYDLMDPGATGETEGGEINGPKDFEEKVYQPLTAAFPNIRVLLDGILGEGDEAVVRWRARATHAGPLGDLPASHRKIEFSGMSWLRFKESKLVEGTDRYNFHSILAFLSSGQGSASVKAFED